MAIAHLHNFLRTSSNSVDIYTPCGIFDYERDGKLIEESCRNKNAGNIIISSQKCDPWVYFKSERNHTSSGKLLQDGRMFFVVR
jgi:hypothetical protein